METKAKEEFKKYRLKKKDYMFYVSKDNMFYSTTLFMNRNKLSAYFHAKPLWLDDILWDVLDMSSNKEEPISLRSIGAFTIQSLIRKKDYTVESTEEIDVVVTKTFEELVALAYSYQEEDFLMDYQTITYQQEVINVIVLIHNGEYDKALAICQNTQIGYFESNNKDFSKLAIKYIKHIKHRLL